MVLLLSGLHRSPWWQLSYLRCPRMLTHGRRRRSIAQYRTISGRMRLSRTIQIHRIWSDRKLQPKEKVLDYFNHIDGLVRQLCAAESKRYCIEEVYKYIVPGLPYELQFEAGRDFADCIRRNELTVESLRANLFEKECQLESSEANLRRLKPRAFAMNAKSHYQQSE